MSSSVSHAIPEVSIPPAASGQDHAMHTSSHTVKRTRAKKTTGEPGPARALPVKKKGTTRRVGRLSMLPEMPLDVLLEVFSYLHPHDLLRLSRASKSLRLILLNRTMRRVWRDVIAALSLPECPQDLSEPQYTSLAFEPLCSLCQSTAAKDIYWVWRLRACKACLADAKPAYLGSSFKTKFITGRFGLDDSEDEELYALVYAVQVKIGKKPQTLYLRSEVYEIREIWNALSNDGAARVAFVQQRIATMHTVNEHVSAYAEWVENVKGNRAEELRSIRLQRKDQAIEHLRALGWSAEIEYILAEDLRLKAFEAHKDLRVSKPLTSAGWTKVKDALVYHCEQIRKDRLADFRRDICRRRLEILQRLLAHATTSFLPQAYPNLADACGISSFAGLINWPVPDPDALQEDGVTEASFDGAMAAFPALAEDWRTRKTQLLVSLLKNGLTAIDEANADGSSQVAYAAGGAIGAFPAANGRPVFAFDTDAIARDIVQGDEHATRAASVDLDPKEIQATSALAIFRCACANGLDTPRLYGIGNALLHRCPQASASSYMVQCRRLELHGGMCIWLVDIVAAKLVLQACNKDPMTVTASEMDHLDARLFCEPCADAGARVAYQWRDAVAHVVTCHRAHHGPIQHKKVLSRTLRLCPEDEFRAKTREPNQLMQGILDDGSDWGCVRSACQRFRNKKLSEVFAHLEQTHGITEPRRCNVSYTSGREWSAPFPSVRL